MKIERIYIACYRHDFRWTRILVASIRRWYPQMPITLIKDRFFGDFNSREMERYWDVSIFKTDQTFGWGFAKLEPLFLRPQERCLVLDSDIVFAGPVLKRLQSAEEDFVVDHEDPTPQLIASNYFDLEKLRAFDPHFDFPGFTFNTGQFVTTSGLFAREELKHLVDWASPARVYHPEIFKLGEQGLLNYWLMKQAAEGRISLSRVKMMETGDSTKTLALKASDLGGHSPHEFLIHWCGLKKSALRKTVRSDLLLEFQHDYYSRIPGGDALASLRNFAYERGERARSFMRGLQRRK